MTRVSWGPRVNPGIPGPQMRKEKLVTLTLTHRDLEQLADGDVLTDGVDDALQVEIDLSGEAKDYLQSVSQEQTLDLESDEPPIPEDLGDLHYQEELMPLAAKYGVIEEIGSRSREDIQDRLVELREEEMGS